MFKILGVALLWMAAMRAEEPPWFSHKLHAPIGMACTSCHTNAEKAKRAGMPSAARCLTCHKDVLKLAPGSRPFKAEYDTLPDYVRFSHARHVRRKIACIECHGDVTKQDETEPANAMNMKACMDCHTRHKAAVACGVCHSVR
jgi:hypothetical protein